LDSVSADDRAPAAYPSVRPTRCGASGRSQGHHMAKPAPRRRARGIARATLKSPRATRFSDRRAAVCWVHFLGRIVAQRTANVRPASRPGRPKSPADGLRRGEVLNDGVGLRAGTTAARGIRQRSGGTFGTPLGRGPKQRAVYERIILRHQAHRLNPCGLHQGTDPVYSVAKIFLSTIACGWPSIAA